MSHEQMNKVKDLMEQLCAAQKRSPGGEESAFLFVCLKYIYSLRPVKHLQPSISLGSIERQGS
jgi:hypothetical protein